MELDIIKKLAQANTKGKSTRENLGKDFEITKETTLREIFEAAYNSPNLDGISSFDDLIHFFLLFYKSERYVGVGVGGILVYDKHVLLYKREKDPEKGHWSMPGGSVRLNEKIETAIGREFRNITGFDIDIRTLILLRVTNHINDIKKGGGKGEVKYHYLSPAFIIPPNEQIIQNYNSLRKKSYNHDYEDEKSEIVGQGKYHLKWFPWEEILNHGNGKNTDNFTIPTHRALESYKNYLTFQTDTEKMLEDELKKFLGGNFG
jgi:ADP-ribose pyrophosphatase YjhB (NUDIX family)